MTSLRGVLIYGKWIQEKRSIDLPRDSRSVLLQGQVSLFPIWKGPVKDASLCTIRRPGDLIGDHVQGDF